MQRCASESAYSLAVDSGMHAFRSAFGNHGLESDDYVIAEQSHDGIHAAMRRRYAFSVRPSCRRILLGVSSDVADYFVANLNVDAGSIRWLSVEELLSMGCFNSKSACGPQIQSVARLQQL